MTSMTVTAEYVINSGLWSLGGLVVGYMLGRAELEFHRRKGQHDDNP